MTRAERIEAAARALMTAYWQKGEHIEVANAAQDLARAMDSRKPQPDPAPAGWVDVEADADITHFGSATSVNLRRVDPVFHDDVPQHEKREHTVRVKLRLPLPAAPVVVEGAIVERAEREEG